MKNGLLCESTQSSPGGGIMDDREYDGRNREICLSCPVNNCPGDCDRIHGERVLRSTEHRKAYLANYYQNNKERYRAAYAKWAAKNKKRGKK